MSSRASSPGRPAAVLRRRPPGPPDEAGSGDAVVVLPSHEDSFVRRASTVAGGPAGRRVRVSRLPARRAFAAAGVVGVLVLAAAVALGRHCRATLWSSPGSYLHACYSDVPTQFVANYLDRVVPYLQRWPTVEFLDLPFGTGWTLWGLGVLVGAGPGDSDGRLEVYDASVVLASVALVVLLGALVALAGRRPYDALLAAASPVLLASGLVGLQLLPAALATSALWVSARGRPLVAGVLLGLAGLYAPALALAVGAALLLVAWRRRRDDDLRRRTSRGGDEQAASAVAGPGDDIDEDDAAGEAPPTLAVGPEVRTVLTAALVWSAGGLPVLLDSAAVWWDAASARVVAGPGYGSAWFLGSLLGLPVPARTTTLLSLVLLGAAVVGVVVLVLRAPRAPRVPVVGLLLLVAALVTAPALPPQAAVLVLPLAVLALPRWRLLLVWGAVEAAAATGTWLYLYLLQDAAEDGDGYGLPPWAYAVLVLARLGVLLHLAWRAAEVCLRPELDDVRTPRSDPAAGEDDPCAPPSRRPGPEDRPAPAPVG